MSRIALVLLFAGVGCAVDEASVQDAELLVGQAPIPQVFTLDVDGTVGGAPITFTVTGLPPGTAVRLVRAVGGGIGSGPCPSVLGGQCLDINGPQGVAVFPFTMVADATGQASRTMMIPAGVPDGTSVGFQAIAPSAGVGSNPVAFVTGPPVVATCTTDDSFEPNDDALNDALGTPPYGFVGELCAGAPYDWYVFDLVAGETISLDVLFTHTADIDIDVWAYTAPQPNLTFSSYVAASTSVDDDENITYTATVDQTLYVWIYNWEVQYGSSTSASSYTLEYSIAP
jgi:hypothetical protein